MASETSARDRLLEGAIGYVSEHGIGDVSLRTLAASLGTSHRMLIYHFGSKEGLLRAIVEELERRQRDSIAQLMANPDLSIGDFSRAMWQQVSDPALWPFEKLFFEVYAQALQGREHATPLLDVVLEPMLAQLTELHRRHGLPRHEARARARLGLAATRGLLLDLLASEDRRGVGEAMELLIEATERELANRVDSGHSQPFHKPDTAP
jgi:AcrR family transcriptional regulator